MKATLSFVFPHYLKSGDIVTTNDGNYMVFGVNSLHLVTIVKPLWFWAE